MIHLRPEMWRLKLMLFWALGLTLWASTVRAQPLVLLPITNSWRYNQTTNFDGIDWKNPGYNDSTWPSGPALLYYETSPNVSPRNTPLVLGRNTYYFRSSFNFSGNTSGLMLTFSNKIDDGAVFYLNGTEVYRLRLPPLPTPITYSTFATSTPPVSADAVAWDVFSIPASNLVSGVNSLAVEVHQVSTNSSDIVFGSALSLTTTAFARGPYLQRGSATNIVVRWRTDWATDSLVRFGTNFNDMSLQVSDPTPTNEHIVTLSNLLPNTRYYYAIGQIGGPTSSDTNQFFITAPASGTQKPTRIWVLGDPGTRDSQQRSVRDAYYNFTGARHTDLWLMLGDNAYDNGLDVEYQAAVFDMYPGMLKKSVLWPALGNHDTAQSSAFHDNYPYFAMFTLPTNGEAGGVPSGTEHYYSFDYGNIHFVCLDSMTASRATNSAMANWLRADLAATTNTWVIAYWHHPPYSKGSHNSDTEERLIEMREGFLPIFEDWGVDVVLTGHSHSYERSMLLDSHYGVSTTLTSNMIFNSGAGSEDDPKGVYTKWAAASQKHQKHQGAVYAVVGSSGQTSGGTLNHSAMKVSLNQLGSMVIDIDGNRLDAKFVRETGQIDDAFTIVKGDVQIASALVQPQGAQLLVTNVAASKTNVVQASTTFSNWLSISTNVSSSNRFHFTDTQSTNFLHRFYRVLRLP